MINICSEVGKTCKSSKIDIEIPDDVMIAAPTSAPFQNNRLKKTLGDESPSVTDDGGPETFRKK